MSCHAAVAALIAIADQLLSKSNCRRWVKQQGTYEHGFAISPRLSREVLPSISRPLNSEGAGNAGRAMRPQPRVQMKKAHEHSHHGHTGTTRHSPRNGFTASFALFPVTTLV
jgi:hypothetical protein